jgi:hypothetical protein
MSVSGKVLSYERLVSPEERDTATPNVHDV